MGDGDTTYALTSDEVVVHGRIKRNEIINNDNDTDTDDDNDDDDGASMKRSGRNLIFSSSLIKLLLMSN